MPVEGATSTQRNIADQYQHCGWTMDNGTLRLALDHATKGRHQDTVESDVVKAVVSSHAARHVGGIVKPLKETLIIEIKCLASGMGGKLTLSCRQVSPSSLWVSISSTSTPGRTSRNGAVK